MSAGGIDGPRLRDRLRSRHDRLRSLDELPTLLVAMPRGLVHVDRDRLLEWIPSDVKDIWYRVNPPRPENGFRRNVHVAHRRYIGGHKHQASWNDDGSRHDRRRFDERVGSETSVREVARRALRLGPDVLLEYVSGRSFGPPAIAYDAASEPLPSVFLSARFRSPPFDR